MYSAGAGAWPIARETAPITTATGGSGRGGAGRPDGAQAEVLAQGHAQAIAVDQWRGTL
jgi:hypothetical protein